MPLVAVQDSAAGRFGDHDPHGDMPQQRLEIGLLGKNFLAEMFQIGG